MGSVVLNDPIFASYVLATTADITELLTHTQVHSVYVSGMSLTQLPIALLSLVHAVRISHATRQLSGGTQSRLRLFQSVVLDLIVLFGGATVVALLLGAPLPILFSPVSIALYASVHVALSVSGLGDALLALHAKAGVAADLVLAGIDATCRTEAIATYALTQVRLHPNPAVSHSLFAQVVVGALLSGGLPLLVGIFHLNSPAGLWSFGTPPWLHKPSLLLFPDLWGGMAVVLVLLFMTSSPEEPLIPVPLLHAAPLRETTTKVLSRVFAPHPTRLIEKHAGLTSLPYLSLREAKAVSALVLFVILAVPLVLRHAPVRARAAPTKTLGKEAKTPKTKTTKATKTKADAAKSIAAPAPVPVPVANSASPAAVATGTTTPADSPAPRKRGRPRKLP